MPGYDQTGPFGQGAGTGRGAGPCGAAQPVLEDIARVPRSMQRLRIRRCRQGAVGRRAGGPSMNGADVDAQNRGNGWGAEAVAGNGSMSARPGRQAMGRGRRGGR
jgi:hypothetical protein